MYLSNIVGKSKRAVQGAEQWCGDGGFTWCAWFKRSQKQHRLQLPQDLQYHMDCSQHHKVILNTATKTKQKMFNNIP